MFSQKIIEFSDNNYSVKFESCGSDCNYCYFKNKKNNYEFKIFLVRLLDTINYKFVSVADNGGLNIYSFSGKFLKYIPIHTHYKSYQYYFFDKMYFKDDYLVIYWNEFIDDPRYKPNTITKFKIE